MISSSTIGGNLFVCNDGSIISSHFLCDGVPHCLNIEDELNCTCASYYQPGILCKEACDEKNSCKCSNFYFSDSIGKCQKFGMNETFSWRLGNRESFALCSDGKKLINQQLINDLIPDCTEGEDEPHLLAIVENQHIYSDISHNCHENFQIPFRDGHSKCFDVQDICVYRLDHLNNLYPCRNGAHMEACEDFECNRKYKCAGYYCIP